MLCAIADDGEEHSIRLNQRVFSDFYPNPGCLYFNDERVDVRSEEESRIVQVLKTASIESAIPESLQSRNAPISKDALILSDDIRQFLKSSPQDNLRRFRDEIVAFIESDEYVEIATNGLPKRK